MLGVVVGDDARNRRAAVLRAWVGDRARRAARRRRRAGVTAPSARRAGRRPTSSACSRSREAAVSVAIVDYGSGNLHSAAKAFERAARDSGHDQPIVVTSDPDEVARADRVVLPGVGAFADCRRGLDAIRRHGRGAREGVREQRPAVPRHLRRHAADGRARPRIRGDAGPRLDRRRGRPHRAGRPGAEDPAHGLEHARRAASRIRCSTASRSARTACMPISCTPTSSSRASARRSRGAGRLRRAA